MEMEKGWLLGGPMGPKYWITWAGTEDGIFFSLSPSKVNATAAPLRPIDYH
jgi:hypothetical protein